MRTMFVMKGLPGSGKSTAAAEMIRKEPGRFVRINRDDLRAMCVGPGNNPHQRDNDRESLVRAFKDELVRQAMREGFDVILDDTHLVSMTVKKLHTLAATIGDVKLIEKGIPVSVDECIRRDALRTGFAHVGEKVIRDMARGAGLDKGRLLSDKETYYAPRWAPGGTGDSVVTTYDPNSPLPKAVICDLDGTLAFLNGRSPYDATHCDQDPPNLPVIECVKAMFAAGYEILFTSGREDKYREPTLDFIHRWVTFTPSPEGEMGPGAGMPRVIDFQLFMRPSGDQRKDNIVKTEIFDQQIRGKYNVAFCLDDRNQVVDNWREMGLCCMQVAPGNF
jgi:predicted kinase